MNVLAAAILDYLKENIVLSVVLAIILVLIVALVIIMIVLAIKGKNAKPVETDGETAPEAADGEPAAKTEEPAPAPVEKKPEPAPAPVEKKPEPAPAPVEKKPEPAPVEKKPEPAPAPAEKKEEPAPAEKKKAGEVKPVLAKKAEAKAASTKKAEPKKEETKSSGANGKWVIYMTNGRYAFDLVASNGEVMLTCGAPYSSLSSAKAGIQTYKTNLQNPESVQVEETKSGDFFVKLFNARGALLATSNNYRSRSSAESAADSIRRWASTAIIEVATEE